MRITVIVLMVMMFSSNVFAERVRTPQNRSPGSELAPHEGQVSSSPAPQ
jgi:hypothetical protein